MSDSTIPAAASTVTTATASSTSSSFTIPASLALPARADVLPVYVDYNATTPLSEAVVAAMMPFMTAGVQGNTLFGNASSGHVYGSSAKTVLESARNSVAESIHATAQEIVFTSGATESLNYAIQGAAFAQRQRRGAKYNHIITCNIEHIATLEILQRLEREEGFTVTILPVNRFGCVSANQVHAALRETTILVSIMLANNEVGSLMPLESIVKSIRSCELAKDVWVHTDASQALGKVSVDVRQLGVDLLTIAGHKLYASKGVGALYIKHDTITMHGGGLRKFMVGANHESNKRAGTENVMLIAGLGAACKQIVNPEELQDLVNKFTTLRDTLHQAIQQHLELNIRQHGLAQLYTCSEEEQDASAIVAAAAASSSSFSSSSAVPASAATTALATPRPRRAFLLHAHPIHRLSNTLSIGFLDLNASEILHRLRYHLSASAGAACHAATGVHLSYVLHAMGVQREYGMGTLRLSVGRYNTIEEMKEVGEWIANTVTSMWLEKKQSAEQAAAASAYALLSSSDVSS